MSDFKESKRAARRHHLSRMKAKARRVSKHWMSELSAQDTAHRAGRLANNLAICSCSGCGNQRKYEGPTLQERRHNQGE